MDPGRDTPGSFVLGQPGNRTCGGPGEHRLRRDGVFLGMEVAMELNLTRDEAELLRAMVKKDIHELLMEIAKTDTREFRDELKAKEETLMAVGAKLAATPSA